MFHYSAIQWLFFFYFYCFVGWVWETGYVSVKQHHYVNRGFMRGPFLPIYGCGAIMMLVVSMPFQDNLALTYVAGCFGATVLELVTGELMEAIFKVRYWDYSNQKFNYKGHICLSSTLAWGVMTVIMTEFVQAHVETLVFAIPEHTLTVATVVLSVYIVVDFTLSFKAALDLRDILMGLDKARAEMEKIQKRLDVLVAVANDGYETKKQEYSMRADELMESLESRFAAAKEHLVKNPGAFADGVREEMAELRARYLSEKEMRGQLGRIKDIYQRSIIKGNPGMYSKKFGAALDELKASVNEKRADRKAEKEEKNEE